VLLHCGCMCSKGNPGRFHDWCDGEFHVLTPDEFAALAKQHEACPCHKGPGLLVLACGDRNWNDRAIVAHRFRRLPAGSVIIEGECRGLDLLAKEVATNFGLQVVPCPARWKDYGRMAGPVRNRKMLAMKPDLVLAFHDDLAKSKGTKDCVNEARRLNFYVEVVTYAYRQQHGL
jgi:hypothetical protein